MGVELVSVTLPRDTWLLLLGWILGKQAEEWEPGFVAQFVATIKDGLA